MTLRVEQIIQNALAKSSAACLVVSAKLAATDIIPLRSKWKSDPSLTRFCQAQLPNYINSVIWAKTVSPISLVIGRVCRAK